MTGREKIEAAFSPDGTPEIPVVICYENIFVRDHWSQLTDHAWWHRIEPDIDRQMAWRRDVIERTGQDWFVLPGGHSRRDRERLGFETDGNRVYQVNRDTGNRQELQEPMVSGWAKAGTQHSVHPDYLPLSQTELDERVPPPTPVDLEQMRADGCHDLPDRLVGEFGTRCAPSGAVSSPLWGCYGLWGFEGMMTMVADKPDLVAYACERFLQQWLPGIREAAERGVRVIWIEETLTDMIGPDAFRRINLPLLRRIVDEIRACGMLSIYYYCGDPTGKWDALLDAGADALSLEESKKGFDIDIDDVVSIVDGRCAVLGNLDAIGILQNGSRDELEAEIRRQIRAGRRNGNRFTMSTGSPVTPETPVDRVREYCDLARDIGMAL